MLMRVRLLLAALAVAVAGSGTGIVVLESTGGTAAAAGGPWCCPLPIGLP